MCNEVAQGSSLTLLTLLLLLLLLLLLDDEPDEPEAVEELVGPVVVEAVPVGDIPETLEVTVAVVEDDVGAEDGLVDVRAPVASSRAPHTL